MPHSSVNEQAAAVNPTPRGLVALDADSFLEFIFTDIAYRPAPLKPSETAAVLRYLRRLALDGVPRELGAKDANAIAEYRRSESAATQTTRNQVEQAAMALWGALLQYGVVRSMGPQRASALIRRHKKTTLEPLGAILPSVLDFIAGFEIPTCLGDPFMPPQLLSGAPHYRVECKAGNVQYIVNPYRRDDISERIYAAYHALRQLGVKRSRHRIADILARLDIPLRSKRSGRDAAWSWHGVNDRIKRFDKQKRKELEHQLKLRSEVEIDDCVRQYRAHLIDYWLSSFRWSQQPPL